MQVYNGNYQIRQTKDIFLLVSKVTKRYFISYRKTSIRRFSYCIVYFRKRNSFFHAEYKRVQEWTTERSVKYSEISSKITLNFYCDIEKYIKIWCRKNKDLPPITVYEHIVYVHFRPACNFMISPFLTKKSCKNQQAIT